MSYRPIEFILDPSVNKLSTSRLLLWVIIAVDILWVICCIKGYPPNYTVTPVSYMLGAITTALCGIYTVSTYSSGNVGVQNFLQSVGRVDPPKGG